VKSPSLNPPLHDEEDTIGCHYYAPSDIQLFDFQEQAIWAARPRRGGTRPASDVQHLGMIGPDNALLFERPLMIMMFVGGLTGGVVPGHGWFWSWFQLCCAFELSSGV
jgi:hypothetical protein